MSGFVVRPYDAIVAGLLMRGTHAAIADLLATTLPSNGTLLDVGTGPGRVPVLVAKRRPDLSVIGIDPSADMLARARRHADGLPKVRFLEAGSEQIPLEDHAVDAVVSSLSSHHWADLHAALAEQVRVLKLGGRLWLFDLRRHLPEGARAAVARSGLTLLEDEPSPLRAGARRRFAVIAAIKPTAAHI